jgi:hypothetical protein
MGLRSIALIVACGLGVMGMLAGAVTAGRSTLPAGNLVQNPGGEVPRGADFPTQNVAPAGWTKGEDTDGSGIQLVRYGPNTTLTSAVPSKVVANALGGGANYFVGGYPSKISTAFQMIDVAGAAAEIAAGGVTACLSGNLGGAKQDTGTALVDLEFLGQGDARLGQLRIGPVTRAQRKSQTTLLRRAAQKPVPSGTLHLRVVLRAQAGRDSANNLGPNSGSADNISVALIKGGACDPALTVTCVKKSLVAMVTPSAVAPTQRVRFSVKGGQKTKLAAAKRTSRFTMDGLTGQLTVTAAVSQKGGATITLTKRSRHC